VNGYAPGWPEFGEVASKVAAIAARLPGAGNAFRDALQRVSVNLAPSTRNLTQARHDLAALMLALDNNGQPFDEPETWLTCACTVLLAFEQMRASGGVEGPAAGTRLS
jgi:hypothetical protein